MPRVPEAPIGGATERALPGARAESIATPALLSGAADDQLALGKSLIDAGTGLDAVAFKMQQRANADALFNAESALKSSYIQFDANLRQNRQGNLAKGAASDVAGWWKDGISKSMETLENEEQRRMFAHRIMPVQLQSVHSTSQFEGAQLDLAHDQSWKADKSTTTNFAAATPTPDNVSSAVADLKRMNAYQAQRKGWDTKVLDSENEADITNLHKQVIQNLVATNKDAAAGYFKAHEMEIAGSQRAEIGQFAEKATAAAVGLKAATDIWNEMGPKSDRDAPEVDKMKKRARELYKDNTFALDAALSTINDMTADFKNGRAERDHKTVAGIAQAVEGGATLAQVQQMPGFIALGGDQQQQIRKHFEADENTKLQRAAAIESRAASAESRSFTQQQRADYNQARDTNAAYFKYSDPTVLSSMSRSQVEGLYFVMGKEHTQALLQRYDSFEKNGGKLSEGKIDRQDFLSIADARGLPAFVHKPTDDQSATMGRVQSAVEQAIGAKQSELKRDLTRPEKTAVMQGVIDDQVLKGRFFVDKVPVSTLGKDDMEKAYVLVDGGHKIKLAEIPAATRVEISGLLRQANLPVTEQNIAQAYANKYPKRYPGSDAYTKALMGR